METPVWVITQDAEMSSLEQAFENSKQGGNSKDNPLQSKLGELNANINRRF